MQGFDLVWFGSVWLGASEHNLVYKMDGCSGFKRGDDVLSPEVDWVKHAGIDFLH